MSMVVLKGIECAWRIDTDIFFIGISVSQFVRVTEEFCIPR